ncbi:hypothetical protein [Ideonella sp.]|uniref:hypothetical protein n=1 Tax=Ideonella sp. TaxID=1929293 RepID=UPI002B45D153|nr:hypothetical protein [Ideonella sp.]HJV68639.1 hypothetical protein [Ideonella sp.]
MPAEGQAGRRPRAGGVATGLGVVAALGLAAWYLLNDGTDALVSGAAAESTVAAAALDEAARRWAAALASGEAASTAAPPRVAAPSAAAVDPACPPAWRALAGQRAGAIDRAFRRLRPAALAHAAALLAGSADPFERLAGQLIAARARAPDEALPPEAFLALVSEALGGNDPRVAGLASQLCANPAVESPAACSSLLPQRWAAVDPDNVQPWLAMAAEAQDRGDVATVREAMARAAEARTSRLASADLVRLAASPALQALAPVEREVLAVDLLGTGVALTEADTLDVSRLCAPGAMGPGRLAQCSAVAELLVGSGQTMLERGTGIAIGRRSGWPAERVDALEAEHREMADALGDALAITDAGDATGPLTLDQACRSFERIDAVMSLIASDSEVALARRAASSTAH